MGVRPARYGIGINLVHRELIDQRVLLQKAAREVMPAFFRESRATPQPYAVAVNKADAFFRVR